MPSWSSDGIILFGGEPGILRVPASGGTPAVVIPARSGERLRTPQLLPDGDTVIFTVTADAGERIDAQQMTTGKRTVLVETGGDARYLPTGHLVYVVGSVLMGVAFDAGRLVVTGSAVPLAQDVAVVWTRL